MRRQSTHVSAAKGQFPAFSNSAHQLAGQQSAADPTTGRARILGGTPTVLSRRVILGSVPLLFVTARPRRASAEPLASAPLCPSRSLYPSATLSPKG